MADEYIPPRGTRLAGKVAIVTGSGRGIGRAHAIALAAEGAKVVVNDPGVERTGAGGSSAPADDTVAFIRENGGEAVANYNSVAGLRGSRADHQDGARTRTGNWTSS